MDQQQITDEQLWEFIDGFSSLKDKEEITMLIGKYPELNSRYNTLLQLQQSLNELSLDEPSMRFTNNVLDKIATPKYKPAFSYINKWMIRGIAAFFILAMVVLIIATFILPNDNATGIGGLASKSTSLFQGHFLQYILMLNVVGILLLMDARYNKRKVQSGSL